MPPTGGLGIAIVAVSDVVEGLCKHWGCDHVSESMLFKNGTQTSSVKAALAFF